MRRQKIPGTERADAINEIVTHVNFIRPLDQPQMEQIEIYYTSVPVNAAGERVGTPIEPQSAVRVFRHENAGLEFAMDNKKLSLWDVLDTLMEDGGLFDTLAEEEGKRDGG
ncbi:MAG: hypothetical protein H0W34_05835 [Pyrinomonadaceae bacterium]|nr:hypothetical protein [Pyrinomonadaceae bacterium]